MFRDAQRTAWTFHRATCRWTYNALSPETHMQVPGPPEEHDDAPYRKLPPARVPAVPLGTLLQERRTCRRFAGRSMELEQLATIAWAGYGATGMEPVGGAGSLEVALRTVPSPGGLYPLELWFVVSRVDGLTPGFYHYQPVLHGLELIRDAGLPRSFTTYLFMGQPYVADAAVVAVLSAVPGRSLEKYSDRGYRYLLLEAGHAMQNLNLAAQAVGLGSCNLGGFYDDELATLFHMDPERQFPLYASAVGIPDPEGGNLRLPPVTARGTEPGEESR